MRMHSGGYCRASDMASVGVLLSQVENSSSVVNSTGMRSWLIVSTSGLGVVVKKL
jgi:DNA-binding CsgD family transcriptional regulator